MKYLGGVAKNRKVKVISDSEKSEAIRLDVLSQSLTQDAFTKIKLQGESSKTLWVKVFEAELSRLKGSRKIAIVMNAPTFTEAEDVDYFVTNFNPSLVSSQWVIDTYSQRNWVEVFYREVKGWLGLKEYQVRSLRSLKRHFILVFCAYTFILWHKLTGGLRRRWANKSLQTFPEAKTVISYSYIFSFCGVAQLQSRPFYRL